MGPTMTADPAVEPLDAAAAAIAARLGRITVEVRGRGRGGVDGGAVGSGVIWHPDGLILTNAHVARGDVLVVLADQRRLCARLVARDPDRDLAALVVDATDLPAAQLADSSALRVGELVLAVGNPLGLVRALSAGLVHAVGPRFIHADLRLAPGNSGGPLADACGRVVGLNAMIVGGLAVAVPSREAQRFVREQSRRG
jgi:serine protease Do